MQQPRVPQSPAAAPSLQALHGRLPPAVAVQPCAPVRPLAHWQQARHTAPDVQRRSLEAEQSNCCWRDSKPKSLLRCCRFVLGLPAGSAQALRIDAFSQLHGLHGQLRPSRSARARRSAAPSTLRTPSK